MRFSRCPKFGALAIWLALAPVWANAESGVIQQQQAQLERLGAFVDQAQAQLGALKKQLETAAAREKDQAARIDALEATLAFNRSVDDGWTREWRKTFFQSLADQLPSNVIYQVESDHLRIATDPVFVFSRGEIGAEGRSRLAPIAPALLAAAKSLPAGARWRLDVAGHTDNRLLRGNARFRNNWQLSAARAVGLVEYWLEQGVPAQHLRALALADTEPSVNGDDKASLRQNRRIEVRFYLLPPHG